MGGLAKGQASQIRGPDSSSRGILYLLVVRFRKHYLAAPAGRLLERTPHCPTRSYLLTEGPYRYSCNPIYPAALALWLGWIVF
jgi:protein-S-isoprenylcysteine O-methyltransferase Ste14